MAARANLGGAELPHRRTLDLATELLGHGLHAVADAEDRHAEIPHRLPDARRPAVIDGSRTAREDDATRGELADESVGNVVRMELAVDVRLAHATRDQLGVLCAEIEDEDPVVHPFTHHSIV